MRLNASEIILFLICCNVSYFIDATLNSLRYYEKLHTSSLSHSIVKRGTNPSSNKYNTIKQLSFKILGKNFRLMLTPGTPVLSSRFQAYSMDASGKKEYLPIDHENFYEGRVFGEKLSHANVHYEEGLITASIKTDEDIYVIEPSWRHFPDDDNQSMIAYRHSDLKLTEENNNKRIVCGSVKVDANVSDEEMEKDRVKRQSGSYKFDSSRTRCPLLLVADYRFYQSMGGRSKKSTINYLISLIDRVHKIYQETEWKDNRDDKGFKGFGFVIEEIIVHNESTPVPPGHLHYNMERSSWDVRDLLEVFSRQSKHQSFCLAHLFTDIKFEGGILGLAYVGSSRRNSVGGICTPEYFKSGLTLYLNSGLSSSRNHYGQRVITREADLVTAHEFGHNWGSEHDPISPDAKDCSPDSKDGGSFLMYTYSVSGYDVNNKKFSPCSLRSIRAVLLEKSHKCFKEPQESFCGNSRVESGEECDVGLISSVAEDPCCRRNCTLKKHAKCSDKNSPCCRDCDYLPAGVKCRDANANVCRKEAICTGFMAECPEADPEVDKTPCIEKGLCLKGKCLPYCETKGRHSCMCDKLADACRRCCRETMNSSCTAQDPNDILGDGTPCIYGFCNKGHCEKTVQDIVERFWDLIEDININSVIKFLNDNIVGTVIILSIIVWIPASCLVSYVDHKRRKEEKKQTEWFDKRNKSLIHSSDRETRIIRVPRQRATGNLPSLSQPGLSLSLPRSVDKGKGYANQYGR